MSDVVDLDVIRPKPKIIKLGDKRIDVSFIPCGITFDIDQLMRQLHEMDMKEVEKGGAEAKKAFDLTVEICVTFCQHKYPDMDRKWFMSNVDVTQVQLFAETIQNTLRKSYETVAKYGEGEGKN